MTKSDNDRDNTPEMPAERGPAPTFDGSNSPESNPAKGDTRVESAGTPGAHRPVKVMGAQPSEPRPEVSVGRSPAPPSDRVQPTGADVTPPLPPPAPVHKVNRDLRREEQVKGSHPGDRYIRYGRNIGPFRRKGGGILAASLAAEQPRSRYGRAFNSLKRVLIGRPISSEHSIHERLTKIKALAVLSSDALSSVAYATEEIVKVLILGGAAVLGNYTMPIGIAVMLLLAIVAASYRQTIAAYPRGGGSYIVAKDNLGTLAGLTAAASILIDYTMTVAVSISSGMDAVNSLFRELIPYKVEICLVIVLLLTVANLRGVREAGNIFAVPTYLFVFGILAMIGYGLLREFIGLGGGLHYQAPLDPVIPQPETLTQLGFTFLLLRAFSQGCTALTGVEAISDGVPAFKPPEYVNARATLMWMAGIAIAMFGGITFLAQQMQVLPSASETVLSQVARNILGGREGFSGIAWFYINITTALILVLAANTAYSDFPRLSYFLARDKFMPHQYSFRGDRLAFSWGIVTLATLAAVLIVAFRGDVTALIPLYTVGVFNSFTLSQAGMVRRWWRTRTQGWQRSMIINGIGAAATFIVLIISAVTKFIYGAWIVVVLIPILIAMFLAINRHYRRFQSDIEHAEALVPDIPKHTIIVPVAALNNITMSAVRYARSLNPNVTAVHIAEGEDPEEAERFNNEWHRIMGNLDVPLVIIESPYRSLVGPLLSYIDALDQQSPDDTITIVLPEMLPSSPWEYLLHGQSALRLKARLLFRPNTVVANIPYRVGTWRKEPESVRFLRQIPWGLFLVSSIILVLAYLAFFPHR